MKRAGKLLKLHRFFLFLLLPLILCGCRKGAEEAAAAEDTFYVYYVNAEGNGLYRESVPEYKESTLEEMIGVLSEPSEKLSYIAPIGNEYRINSVSLTEGLLQFDFSEEYRSQDKILELLRRAAVVRTLTQLPNVDSVSYFVEGQPLEAPPGVPVGVMNGDQFITNAGREINAYEKTEITLYFADESGTKLHPRKRTVVYSSNIPLDKVVSDELAKGILEGESGYPIMNPDTKVISTTVADGICYVNLSPEFLTQPYSVSSEVTIYGIVNSLVELPGINRVSISVNGDTAVVYRESINLSQSLERNLELVEQ